MADEEKTSLSRRSRNRRSSSSSKRSSVKELTKQFEGTSGKKVQSASSSPRLRKSRASSREGRKLCSPQRKCGDVGENETEGFTTPESADRQCDVRVHSSTRDHPSSEAIDDAQTQKDTSKVKIAAGTPVDPCQAFDERSNLVLSDEENAPSKSEEKVSGNVEGEKIQNSKSQVEAFCEKLADSSPAADAPSQIQRQNNGDADESRIQNDTSQNKDSQSLQVRLGDKEYLKKLNWTCIKKKGFLDYFFKQEKDLLKNCFMELREANGLAEAKISWVKSDIITRCTGKIDPHASEIITEGSDQDSHDLKLCQLALNNRYQVSIMLETLDKDNAKEFAISFWTGPQPPRNIHLEGNTLHWDTAEGAVEYDVKITSPNSPDEKHTVQENNVGLKYEKTRCGKFAKAIVTAIDKSGCLKTIREQDIHFDDSNAPQEVCAEVNRDDPHRSIDAKWSHPRQGIPDSYKLNIITSDGRRHYEEEVTTCKRWTFRNLISNQAYYVEVSAVWEDNMQHRTRSKIVNTKFRQRNQVDISRLGKVKEFRKRLEDHGDIVRCYVSWKLPELGGENNNFAKQKTLATAVDSFDQKAIALVPLTEGKDGYFPLEWGKEYWIKVTVTYKDLDTLQVSEAKFEEPIQTDLEAPSDIRAVTDEESVQLWWKSARGATRYRTRIFDEKGGSVCDSATINAIPAPHARLKFGIGPKLTLGRKYNFEITSIDSTGREKIGTAEIVLEGGEDIPTNPRISTNDKNPHRSLEIKWDPPKAQGRQCAKSQYECTLFLVEGNKVCESKKTFSTTATFSRLKQGTKYFGVIKLLKADGERRHSVYTNHCKTKSGKSKMEPKHIIQHGRVSNLSVQYSPFTNGNVDISVTWNDPKKHDKRDEDYTMTEFEIVCKDHTAEEAADQREVVPVGNSKYTHQLQVSPGKKYSVCVAAIYVDIDTDEELRAESKREIHVGAVAPELKIKYEPKQMCLSWGKVIGAAKYKLKIVDATNNEKPLFNDEDVKSPMNVPLNGELYFGRLCQFHLTVQELCGEDVKPKPLEEVIGGRNTPHSLQLNKVRKFKRRLRLAWRFKGSEKTDIKEVMLFEEGRCKPVQEAKVMTDSAEFHHLKSSTEYHAEIEVMLDGQLPVRCRSNAVTTEQDQADLGMIKRMKNIPEEICMCKNSEGEPCLKWKEVDFGEAFRTTGYEISIEESVFFLGIRKKTMISKKHVRETYIRLPELSPNSKYLATIRPKLLNIDDDEEEILKGSRYEFDGGLDYPTLHDPVYKAYSFVIKWDPIPAAKEYELEVIDASTRVQIFAKKIPDSKIEIDIKGELRVGRRCSVALTAIGSQTRSPTKLKELTIGGEEVPQNVVVEKNNNNPRRCLDIQFKKPACSKSPIGYDVTARPPNGRRKTVQTRKLKLSFRNLRSDTRYFFEVNARYEDSSKSKASTSGYETTDPDPRSEKLPSTNQIKDVGTAEMKIENSIINSEYNASQQQEDATVQNAKVEIVQGSTDREDIVRLNWTPPTFSNNSENFVVENYIWRVVYENANEKEIRGGEVVPKDSEERYETGDITLELGRSYKFLITTKYENIDQDTPNITSTALTLPFHARPCKPKEVGCECNYNAEKLNVRWNLADGAEEYIIKLFLTGKSDPHRVASGGKHDTRWSWDLYTDIKFGDEFYVEVTAIGKGNTKHSARSHTQIIGGNRVPKTARANPDPESPTTAAIVQWEPPDESPDEYEVKAYPVTSGERLTEEKSEVCRADECTIRMKGLHPGTEYVFKVFAFHKGEKSGGSRTNQIHTTAGPGKAEITLALPCQENESHAIEIELAEQKNCSEYKLVIADDEKKDSRTIFTEVTRMTISALLPRTKYKITAAGGTGGQRGFGNDSNPVFVTTGRGRPTRVRLRHDEENPESALVLSFEKTGETGVSYRVLLRDDIRQVKDETSIESTVHFKDLVANTRYRASVGVVYEDNGDRGEQIASDYIWTAPDRPTKFSAEAKTENGISFPIVRLSWETNDDCNVHQINIKRAEMHEASICVTGKSTYEYQCPEETCDYSFTVQARNSSKIFSKESEERTVRLPPTKIRSVAAYLNEETDKIVVKWEKPDNKAQSFHIIVKADGAEIAKDDTVDTNYEITPDNDLYEEYLFLVYPLDENGQKPDCTESNIVRMRPPDIKILSVEPNPSAPSSSMIINWERSSFSDIEYELLISPRKDDHENIVVCRGKDSCTYECASPGSKYKVRVQSRRKGVPGRFLKPVHCQLAPLAPTEVSVLNKPLSGKSEIEIKILCESRPHHFLLRVKDADTGKIVKGPWKSIQDNLVIRDSLRHGARYTVSAQSVAAKQEKFPSKETFSSPIQMPPAKMSEVTVEEKDGMVSVSWRDLEPKVDHYIVYWGRGSEELEQIAWHGTSFEKRNLGIGETIRVRVAGVNGGGIGQVSDVRIHRTAPFRPTNVCHKLSESDPETSIAIEYTDNTRCPEKMYFIYLNDTRVGKTKKLQYIAEDLTPGTAYKVSISSVVGDKESSRRYAVEQAVTAPLTIQEVRATQRQTDHGKKIIAVSWQSAGLLVDEYQITAFSHEIFEDTAPLFCGSFSYKARSNRGEQMGWEFTSMLPGKFYSFDVKPMLKTGDVIASSSNRAFAGWERPQEISVSLDEGKPYSKAQIQWIKPSCVDIFEISITDSTGQVVKKDTTPNTDYHIENGTPGESYHVCLRWGFSGIFDSQCLTKVFTFAPPPPTKVSLVHKSTLEKPAIKILIECGKNKPDFFNIVLHEETTGTVIAKLTREAYKENFIIDTGLCHGQIYIVSVQSVTEGLERFPSVKATSASIIIPPEKVGQITVNEESGMLTLSWPALTTKVDHYLVNWAQGSEKYHQTTVRGTEFEKPTMGIGETITVQVAGVNGGGTGTFSDEVVHETIPSSPTTAKVELGAHKPDESLLVQYTDEARHPRKRYVIYVNDMRDGDTSDLRYKVTGLTPGSANKISITSTVNGRESDHCFPTESGVTVPGQVENITAEVTSDRTMIIKWKQPNENVPDSYKVERILNDGHPIEEISKDPEFRLAQVENEAVFKIRVAAVNSSGAGKWSKHAKVWTGPPPPRNVTAMVDFDHAGCRYMNVRFDDEQDPAKEYFIALIDDRGRKKVYRTRSLSTRIRNFGELQNARSFSVAVYSRKGNVRSEVALASEPDLRT